jgi:hypothetical protein
MRRLCLFIILLSGTFSGLGVVINLKLKRSIKKGWFGKAYGGIGPGGDRTNYETGAIVNSFRDTLQVSGLAYSNNINKAGFTYSDLNQLGGFNRSGSNSFGTYSDGGISVNGVSFGGTGSGLQQSSGSGINMNHDPSSKIKLNFQYFYGHINSDFRSISNTQQFIRDTTLQTISSYKNISSNADHRFSVRLSWKIDSVSSIDFRPSFILRKTSSNNQSFSVASSNFKSLMNESTNESEVSGTDKTYSHEVSYRRSFKKKGRNIFINQSLSIGGNANDQLNHYENTFYTTTPSYSKLQNQLRQRDYDNLRTAVQLTFNEPLSKTVTLNLYEIINYFRENDQVVTFNWNPLSEK